MTYREASAVPTRRIFELMIVTSILIFPARATVKMWGRKQLATRQEGTPLYAVGEVVVTVL
jgi:hypothetical protein